MTVGLDFDVFTVKRPGTAADTEGNPTGALITVLESVGTYGSPSSADLEIAAQAGQQIEAAVATRAVGIRPGDLLTIRGQTYRVTSVRDVRLHNRVLLRRFDG